MSKEEFNNWHEKRNVDIDLDTPWHKFFLQQIEKIDLENKRILEIGCGRGGFAIFFHEKYEDKFKEYLAADFSDSAIAMGKEYAHNQNLKNIQFELQDIQNIKHDDNSFDIVISFETVEHVPNCRKAINELFRVLKPGGKLILTTPNYMGFFGLYRIYLRLTGRKWTEVGQPINRFVMIPRTLFWLKSSGFKVKHFESEIISFPWFGKRKVYHLKWKKPRFIFKWFGLQSFFICEKPKGF